MSGPVSDYIVDPGDRERVAAYKWYRSHDKYPYLRCNAWVGHHISVTMHIFLFGKALPGMDWDHVNGNTSDNRRANLRIVSHKENCRNRAAFKTNRTGTLGVCRAGKSRWRAYIHDDARQIHLGTFATIEEAVSVRQAAELKLFGVHAPSVCRKETA
jgi:hypothetical protein